MGAKSASTASGTRTARTTSEPLFPKPPASLSINLSLALSLSVPGLLAPVLHAVFNPGSERPCTFAAHSNQHYRRNVKPDRNTGRFLLSSDPGSNPL